LYYPFNGTTLASLETQLPVRDNVTNCVPEDVLRYEHLDFVEAVELNATFGEYVREELQVENSTAASGYAVVLQGTLHLNATADYTFFLASVDGSGLKLTSKSTGQSFELENDGVHDYLVKSGSASLDEDDYDFILKSFHLSGSFLLSVSVSANGSPPAVLRAATSHDQLSVSTDYPHAHPCEKDPCETVSVPKLITCSERGQCAFSLEEFSTVLSSGEGRTRAWRKAWTCACDIDSGTGKMFTGKFCQLDSGDDEGMSLGLAIVVGIVAVLVPALLLLLAMRGHSWHAAWAERRRLRRKADEAIEVMQWPTHCTRYTRYTHYTHYTHCTHCTHCTY
jgi:hypothetical protein